MEEFTSNEVTIEKLQKELKDTKKTNSTYKKAIEEASVVQRQCMEAIQKVKEENQRMADTITRNKMGKIYSERKELLLKVEEAREIQKECEAKLKKLTELIEKFQNDQKNIDEIIEKTVEEKTKKLKDECKAKIQSTKKRTERLLKEKDEEIEKKHTEYKKKLKYTIISVIIYSILIAILAFLF